MTPEPTDDAAMEDLLIKSLTGEADAAEETRVQQWLDATPGATKTRDHYRLLLEESRGTATAPAAVDTDAAWGRFRQRVGMADGRPVARRVRIPVRAVLRAAAGLALLVGMSAIGWHYWSTAVQTQSSGEGTLAVQLPDGSAVTLNRRSSISYPRRFAAAAERTVQLSGEGFFEVTPNKAKPFVVHSGEAEVTVVGTSFNVKSDDRRTEVIVETGRVRVGKAGREVELAPTERAVVLHDRATPVKMRARDVLHNYYRTGAFTCDATPLARFVDVLAEAYDADIRIADPALRNLTLTATFRGASLDEVLDILTATFPQVQVERRGAQILLK